MPIRRRFLAGLLAAALWGQGHADVPADTVIATLGGRKITAGEFQKFIAALPPQVQENFQKDRKEFMRQYALLVHLSRLAEKSRLDEQSPVKERLEYARMQVLVQAQIEHTSNSLLLAPGEAEKFYETNQGNYSFVKVKVIYIPFSENPQPSSDPKARKVLSEAEAVEKARGIVKEARAGADFVLLVKAHSEDPTSAARDGDFGAIKRSDNVPEDVKKVVFALRQGEVSDPVRQPNGLYVFRAEEVGLQPFDEVSRDIVNSLKQAKFQQWFETQRSQLDLKFENDAYFSAAPAAQPAAVR